MILHATALRGAALRYRVAALRYRVRPGDTAARLRPAPNILALYEGALSRHQRSRLPRGCLASADAPSSATARHARAP